MKPESHHLFSASTNTSHETLKKNIPVLLPLTAIVLSFAYIVIGISCNNEVIQNKRNALILLAGPLLQALWVIWVVQSARHRQQFFL